MILFVHSKVEITNLAISKTKSDASSFVKYNIEASIDEIENNEEFSVLKYGFVVLSDDKNIRLGIEGLIKLSGKNQEREQLLKVGPDNIPEILHLIYKELFSVVFMITKSVNVPCPPYVISEITPTNSIESEKESSKINEKLKDVFEEDKKDTKSTDAETNLENIYEKISVEELNKEYTRLTEEYSRNPASEVLEKINKISETIAQKNKSQIIESTN